MTVLDIVKSYLKENGYDGLYNPDALCACLRDDLAPCEDYTMGCAPGYKKPCQPDTCPIDGECEWHIEGTAEE